MTRTEAAAVKFFLFGVLSTAVMLFGMSLIYGITRSTNLVEIAGALKNTGHDSLVGASILLIIAGLFWVAIPYVLRDQINWSTRSVFRWRFLHLLAFIYGGMILTFAFTRY